MFNGGLKNVGCSLVIGTAASLMATVAIYFFASIKPMLYSVAGVAREADIRGVKSEISSVRLQLEEVKAMQGVIDQDVSEHDQRIHAHQDRLSEVKTDFERLERKVSGRDASPKRGDLVFHKKVANERLEFQLPVSQDSYFLIHAHGKATGAKGGKKHRFLRTNIVVGGVECGAAQDHSDSKEAFGFMTAVSCAVSLAKSDAGHSIEVQNIGEGTASTDLVVSYLLLPGAGVS